MINKETYKRLTERRGGLVIDNCGNCPNVNNLQGCTDKNCYEIMKNRLAELEDKIEDGTLIELPCKVGDIVYQFDNGGEIYELMILHINIYKGKPYYETDAIDFDNRAIGESIFLTKAEAEARLKELQEQCDNN